VIIVRRIVKSAAFHFASGDELGFTRTERENRTSKVERATGTIGRETSSFAQDTRCPLRKMSPPARESDREAEGDG